MTSGDLLELFRDEMADQATPYLWGDDLVFGYINDAQNRFCRLTDGISDATTAAVTQIAIAPAAQWYPYHSSITKLRQAYRADTGAPVDIINQEDMPTRGWRLVPSSCSSGAMNGANTSSISAPLSARMRVRSGSTTVLTTMGRCPESSHDWRTRSAASSAFSTESTKGMRIVSNCTLSNCVSTECPMVSAVMPVPSEM